MPFKDIREFIARLEREGEAKPIDEEVDWNLLVGAVLRRSYEFGMPAPFFQKIKDYPEGYRIFGGSLSNYKRLSIAMDMDPGSSQQQLIEEYLIRKKKPIKPVQVETGPCKENIIIGDEIDLFKFPVPLVHDGDGGRYIGTWHLNITKAFDGSWVNWGMYRMMVHNKNTLGIMSFPPKHLGKMYLEQYEPKKKKMEIAIAIGVEPLSTLCAATGMPYGLSEAEVVGGLRGSPVELTRCETVDLEVPASSEIVIEGEIYPGERMNEGPFGEFTGYMSPGNTPKPIVHVKAITHRNDPILTMSCVGVPIDENHILDSVTRGAEILEPLRTRGIPVTGVSLFPETSAMLAVVAIKRTPINMAETVSSVIWGSEGGQPIAYIVIVNDDVNPFDMGQVLHAIATKCHPYNGIIKHERAYLMRLAPWASTRDRKYQFGAKVCFDCTWPVDWEPSEIPIRISFNESYPADVREKAIAIWQKYGK